MVHLTERVIAGPVTDVEMRRDTVRRITIPHHLEVRRGRPMMMATRVGQRGDALGRVVRSGI